MDGPTAKYRGASEDANGVPLYWDGHPDHFPMRGASRPALKPEEVAAAELVFHEDYGYFLLPDDREAYLKVKDQLTNGLGTLVREVPTPDPRDPSKLHVHLWWVLFEAVPGQPDRRPEPPRQSPYLPGSYW